MGIYDIYVKSNLLGITKLGPICKPNPEMEFWDTGKTYKFLNSGFRDWEFNPGIESLLVNDHHIVPLSIWFVCN